MFRFEYPWVLYFLLFIPILYYLQHNLLKWRKRQRDKLGDNKMVINLMPEYSSGKPWAKFFLQIVGLFFIIIALANPQWGTKKEKVAHEGYDVFILLDVSTSMYANDVLPNRMEQARHFAKVLVSKMRSNRVGVILFAGEAYLHSPLTSDIDAVELFIDTANPDMVTTQGTAVADALKLAQKSFGEDSKGNQAVILISDGEEHDGEAISMASELAKKGIQIFTVGVGTPEGSKIPIFNENGSSEFKVDVSGNVVVSKLNENNLRKISQTGKGTYLRLVNSDKAVNEIMAGMLQLKKYAFEQRSFSAFESYYQYFLFFGLCALLLDFFITNQRNNRISTLLFDETDNRGNK
ncbi:MAG: VWA domain-containing protein [Saprospiraceae bacterium]|nr:VWA domain-containing protein [Saprospiraceae bacterium]